MIPVRLSLRNFLSYGEAAPPLEMEGIGLACLCGENGHGKSSLIDAITWALWGRARGRDLDALIHQGRRQMTVEFEFVAGEARYRVIRRRQRVGARGASRASLEFQVHADGEWRTLTEPSIALTEAAIERTLRLSYETFVNSALLLQGQANQFTAAGASARKRVLADILQLRRYDDLEARAREHRRRCADDAVRVEAELAALGPQIERLPELQAERVAVSERLAETLQALDQISSGLRAAEAKQAHLDRLRADHRNAERTLEREHETLARVQSDHDELVNALAADEPLAATAAAIEAGYERLLTARRDEQRWASALMTLRATEERVQNARQSLARSEAGARQRLAALRATQSELRRRATSTRLLEEQLAGLKQREDLLVERGAEAAAADLAARSKENTAARLQVDLHRLTARADDTTADLQVMETAVSDGEIHCPLCRSRLSEQQSGALSADLTMRLAENRAESERLHGRIVEIHARAAEHWQRGRALQMVIDAERAALTAERATLTARLDDARGADQQAAAAQLEAEQLERGLADGAFAGGWDETLRRLEAEQDATGYDPAKHRRTAALVEKYAVFEQRREAVVGAVARVDAGRAALERQQRLLEAQRRRVSDAATLAHDLAVSLADVSTDCAQVGDRRGQFEEMTARRTALDQHLGGIDRALADCAAFAVRYGSLTERRLALGQEEGIYADLASAFGRKGVQAFIIDGVLPEVEEETNRLLSLMTDGRMRVHLETQRENRSGETAETLDILIEDEFGARDYEMYSGGEAFRVDLALRIALSKLLARRAGSPLSTLIIDEGFGSQDASGCERLIEAVTAIQSDFRCLLVVTHMEEIKQRFDTRIEVTKDARGSTARVVRL